MTTVLGCGRRARGKPGDPIPLPFLGGPEHAEWAAGFWSLVAKDGPETCWLWIGNLHPRGYGVFSFGSHRQRLAHRIAYAIAKGEVPAGRQVNHSCDNPPCCNPAHLHLGTHVTNMEEMALRDRAGRLRFPSHVVDTMRQMRAEGALYREIAARYGTTESTAQSVVSGSRRHHLPPTVRLAPPIRSRIKDRISLTAVSLLVRTGCGSPAAIAALFGLDSCSLQYALARMNPLRLSATTQIAALIAGLPAPLIAPGRFALTLTLDQETGLAAGNPARALVSLFRQLVPRRLTKDEVVELRTRYSNREPLASLSQRFGISVTHVIRVGKGRTWASVPGHVDARRPLRSMETPVA